MKRRSGKRNSGDSICVESGVGRSGFKGLNSKKRGFDNSGSTEEASEERCVVLIRKMGSKGKSSRERDLEDCCSWERKTGNSGSFLDMDYHKKRPVENGFPMKSSGSVMIKMVTGAHGEHLACKRKSEDSLKILPEEPQTKYRKLEKGNGQNMYQRKEKTKINGSQKIKDKKEKNKSGPEQVGIDVAEEEKLFRDSVTPSIKLFVFNIVLPTIDIFLDIVLIPKLFKNGFWGSGTIVVAGIVTSFTFTSLAWWRMESRKQKKWSWIFLLLQLWPQLRALQVAALMRIYKSNLVQSVPFLVNSENLF